MEPKPPQFLTVADFLENKAFRRWVKERKAKDRVFWQQWLVQNPEQRELYEEAVALFLVIQGIPAGRTEQPITTNVSQDHHQIPGADFDQQRRLNWQWVPWIAAASVLIGLVWWQLKVPERGTLPSSEATVANPTQTNTWQTITNNTDVPKVVLLPENSSVLLYPDSRIRFRNDENNALREVYLNGEGFFEVSKNPAKPFMVYTTTLTTRVLGTSFQVRSFDNEATAFVKVKTGKVAVFSNKSPQKESLLAVNEQLTLDATTDNVQIQESKVPDQDRDDILSRQFTFEFSPIPLVFDQLESSYHIPIRYDGKLLQNCTFTGQLNDVPFLEKIRLICLTIESTYEIVDNQVLIHSRGCS